MEHVGDKNAHKIVVGIPVRSRALGRVRRRRDSSMEVKLKERRV